MGSGVGDFQSLGEIGRVCYFGICFTIAYNNMFFSLLESDPLSRLFGSASGGGPSLD